MYEGLGAVVDGNKVEFKLFLPDNTVDPTQYISDTSTKGQHGIKEIRVIGEFQSETGGKDWDINSAPVMQKNSHPNGVLFTHKINQDLPEGYYQYKYFVTFDNNTTRFVSDPCSKYGGSDQQNENSAFVIGGNTTSVKPISKRLQPKDLIMYEMMIDDFTSEFRGNRAPVDAVHDRLDYLQALGINAIEFMPWTAWPGGGFSWGYDPFQFFSVEYRYVHDESSPADKLYKLKMLINELHQRNIHVIMDGVFNHVRAGSDPNKGFAYKWLYKQPNDSPYIGQFERGGFFEEFDYDNGCVKEFIRDVCLYWLDRFEIDGIRFDFSLGYYRESDDDVGITKLISDIKSHLTQKGKTNVALMLEHLTDNRFEAIDDTNKICATGCWLDPFMFKSHEYSRNGNIDMEILRILDANRDFAQGKVPVTYIENHDHSSIVNVIGGRGRWFKTQPSAIALMTSPGIVMLHNGQEFAEDYFLPNEGDGRVVPRKLRWNEHSTDFVGTTLYSIYQRLMQIRKDHPSLRSPNYFPAENHPDGYGAFPDKDVVVYHRFGKAQDGRFEKFIIVINYSDFDQRIDIPFSANGQWDDLLNGGSNFVANFRLFNQRINSNWGRIYYQKG
jgi:1,4-alpha-glucan branching enzyme